ncbi:hypothetical protein cand_017220 [Cryptosporidium andersoni]|uniref:Uncharacterized protein n=1 Tax=Cryptosporidium andersoni TaxID=117008 RepID=A0A1J4MTJ5_9CRYT|nr:hypothetical protein cand_017220 [Cryptosporidium andersoni]
MMKIGLTRFFKFISIIASIKLSFKHIFAQSAANYRHDFGSSTSQGEFYGPTKNKDNYKPLPWPDKFPRLDLNITDILELHKMTNKPPEMEPILTSGSGSGKAPRVMQNLRPIEIRCPKGWYPWGPLCIAEISLGPRTECFGDYSRILSTLPGGESKQSSSYPGLCQTYKTIGPSMSCPTGMKLRLRYETETNSNTGETTPSVLSWACEGYSVIPYESYNRGFCPSGYNPSFEGCKAFQIIPPTTSCPSDTEVTINEDLFAFHGKIELECNIVTFTKGNIWCPKGFNLISPPEVLDKYEFGEIIPKELARELLFGKNPDNKGNQDVEFSFLNEYSGTKGNSANNTSSSDSDFKDVILDSGESSGDKQFHIETFDEGTKFTNKVIQSCIGIYNTTDLLSNSSNNISEKEFIENTSLSLGNNSSMKIPNSNVTYNTTNFTDSEVNRSKSWIFNASSEVPRNHSPINIRHLQSVGEYFGLQQEFQNGGGGVGSIGAPSGIVSEIIEEAEMSHDEYVTESINQNQIPLFRAINRAQSSENFLRDPVCSVIVAVHAKNCTPLECKNSYIKHLNNILRNWAAIVLQSDPDLGSNLIPNGKDIPFTSAG